LRHLKIVAREDLVELGVSVLDGTAHGTERRAGGGYLQDSGADLIQVIEVLGVILKCVNVLADIFAKGLRLGEVIGPEGYLLRFRYRIGLLLQGIPGL
jgi:hypothetical protein